MRLKAVLFDHDGTLVDSEHTHFLIWEKLLQTYKVCLKEDEYYQNYEGVPTSENAKLIVKLHNLNIDPSILVEEKNKLTREFLDKSAFSLMPYALEIMEYVKQQGLLIAIVTGANRPEIEATIKTYQLEQYIETYVCRDDVVNSKPEPDCYQLAMNRLNISSDDCIAIEDTTTGLDSATSANIKTIVVSKESKADFEKAMIVVNSLEAVKKSLINIAS